jgi:hypothetical protein
MGDFMWLRNILFVATRNQRADGEPLRVHLGSYDSRYDRTVQVGGFRRNAVIAEDALLGPSAWPINLSSRPDHIKIGSKSVVRGISVQSRKGSFALATIAMLVMARSFLPRPA